MKKIFSTLIALFLAILLSFLFPLTAGGMEKNEVQIDKYLFSKCGRDVVSDHVLETGLIVQDFLQKFFTLEENSVSAQASSSVDNSTHKTTVREIQEEEGKIVFENDFVIIKRLKQEYHVIDANQNEVIMTFKKSAAVVYSTTAICIRNYPSVEIERFGVLDAEKGVLQVAESDQWSLIVSNQKYYFLWKEYLRKTSDGYPSSYEWVSDIADYSDDITLSDTWEYVGKCRISSYCYKCNSPKNSYISSIDGESCSEWATCAMNGVKLGTKVYVEGYGIFIVNDRGPRAMNGGQWVDLFVCEEDCSIWCKRNVWIIK